VLVLWGAHRSGLHLSPRWKTAKSRDCVALNRIRTFQRRSRFRAAKGAESNSFINFAGEFVYERCGNSLELPIMERHDFGVIRERQCVSPTTSALVPREGLRLVSALLAQELRVQEWVAHRHETRSTRSILRWVFRLCNHCLAFSKNLADSDTSSITLRTAVRSA
jgi:hypothetical protein